MRDREEDQEKQGADSTIVELSDRTYALFFEKSTKSSLLIFRGGDKTKIHRRHIGISENDEPDSVRLKIVNFPFSESIGQSLMEPNAASDEIQCRSERMIRMQEETEVIKNDNMHIIEWIDME